MRIVVAPDSFKENLLAVEVAKAISAGIERVIPDAEIISIPVADGGEGSVEALITATGGKIIPTSSVDALNRPIQSFYGVLGDGRTAVIEMAAASGLELLSPEERNPLITSTFGTGLLLKAALEAGFSEIILAIGGSATNDGGAGLAQALGFGLQDKNGNPIDSGGGFLGELHLIDRHQVHPLLQNVRITIACDVQNPLLGPSGATRVYGRQKGATPEMIEILEKNMKHFARVLQKEFGVNFADMPGAGAAGGLGAGLMAFCNARITSGFGLISQLTGLEEHITKASIVYTAEGKIDPQTLLGKTISGVAQLAKLHQVPVIALSGKIEGDMTELYKQGVTSVFAIGDRPMNLAESKSEARDLIASAAERTMRLVEGIAKSPELLY